MKYLLPIIVVAVTTLGCKKEVALIDQRNPPGTNDNVFVLSSKQLIFSQDSAFTTSVFAAFNDSIPAERKDVSLLLNNTPFQLSAANHYQDTLNDASGHVFPGHFAKIFIRGTSAADTLTMNVYLTKKIARRVSDFPSDTINLAKDLHLRWNIDKNALRDSVTILVQYLAKESMARDATLPAYLSPLVYNAADNGSFTISKGNLNVFPHNGLVEIEIARGASYYGTLPVSHRHITYLAVSLALTAPLLVK